MHIVFCIPSLQPGGMERVMSVLINEFTEYYPKNEYHLILYGRKRDIFYDIPKSIIVHKPSFIFKNKIRIWHTLKTLYFLRRTIQKINPDSVLSFGERWNNLVLLACFNTVTPIFVSDRCRPNKSLGKIQDFLRRKLYPKAKGIIAQTEQAKAIYLKREFNKNIISIGNPIPSVPSSNHQKREQIILIVGRLIETKHHFELIKIFKEIYKEGWKLVIVGNDALQQNNLSKLKSLVNRLDLEEVVIFTGTIKNVTEWYQKSSVFAFPSSSEGFPNVVGEALAHGLPVVTFDCLAGPRDMVQNSVNGYLVKVKDFKAFKQRLSELMNDKKKLRSMSQKAPDSVKKFNSITIARKYYNFITSDL